MTNNERSRAILACVGHFEDAVYELDALQAGDVDGRISPIKHRIRDALKPLLEQVRAVARDEYLKESVR